MLVHCLCKQVEELVGDHHEEGVGEGHGDGVVDLALIVSDVVNVPLAEQVLEDLRLRHFGVALADDLPGVLVAHLAFVLETNLSKSDLRQGIKASRVLFDRVLVSLLEHLGLGHIGHKVLVLLNISDDGVEVLLAERQDLRSLVPDRFHLKKVRAEEGLRGEGSV